MKKVLIAISVLLVLGGALLFAATRMLDTEQLKALLIQQVRQQTGRELVIDGAIGWRIFPSLGLTLGPVQLKNPAGFPAGNTRAVDAANLEVGLWPLFSRRIEAGEIRLRGLQLHLLTRKDGQSNIDDLLQGRAEEESAPAATEQAAAGSEPASALALSLAGLRLEDASLWLDNRQSGSQLRIHTLNLATGPLAFDTPITLNLDGVLTQAQLESRFRSQGELYIPASRDALRLDNWQLESELSGPDWQARFKSQGNLDLPAGDAPLRLQGWHLDGRYQRGSDGAAEFQSRGELSLARNLESVTLSDWRLQGELKSAALVSQLNSRGTLEATLVSGRERVELQGWHADLGMQGDGVPAGLRQLSLDGVLSHQLARGLTELKGLKLLGEGLQVDGTLSLQQGQSAGQVAQLRFDLRSPRLDLDQLRGPAASQPTPEAAQPAAGTAPAGDEARPASEPDLRALKALDLAGQWQIGEFRSAPLVLKELLLRLDSRAGRIEIAQLSGRAYQGQLQLSGQLDGSQYPVSFRLAPIISGVQIQPLLRDFTGKEPLSGQANLKGQLSGRGLSGPAIRQSLSGQLAMQIEDGAVNGVNVAARIRKAMAAVEGQPYKEEVQRTDFSALTADFTLDQGRASSNNITLQSPLLRIQGRGATHLHAETLDFGFDTSVVGSLKGQGGEDLSQLKNLTLPLTIKGTWAKPQYGLDVESLLRQRLQQKLEQKLQPKLEQKLEQLDEKLQQKLQDKLGKFLG